MFFHLHSPHALEQNRVGGGLGAGAFSLVCLRGGGLGTSLNIQVKVAKKFLIMQYGYKRYYNEQVLQIL